MSSRVNGSLGHNAFSGARPVGALPLRGRVVVFPAGLGRDIRSGAIVCAPRLVRRDGLPSAGRPGHARARPWRSSGRLRERAAIGVAKGTEMTVLEVIIDYAERLHRGVDGSRPDKAEAAPA